MESLLAIDTWPVPHAAAGVATADGLGSLHGPAEQRFRWASVTKVATSLAVLIATEEGVVSLDDVVVPWGATVRHVLAHASGMAPAVPRRLAEPGTRRIYSNAGFELLGSVVERAASIAFGEYLHLAVLEPLGMTATTLEGTAAAGLVGPIGDLLRLGAELLAPVLVADETLAAATAPAFPGIPGVLPGWGRQEDCAFGLGFEVRDDKVPHWTAPEGSPRTFGHFGQSGSFLWVDPDAVVACGVLTDRDFGPWAVEVWPQFSGAVLAEWRRGQRPTVGAE